MSTQCLFLIFLFLLPLALADLKVGFYDSSCPRAEPIIRQVVEKRFNATPSITAALLRMYFHDCFVRGCDASLLIDTTKENPSEKSAVPNLTVGGFDLIDEAKEALEKECRLTVSCADIIALATRDAVALAKGPNYTVPTGRRDGLVSNPDEVKLPGPTIPVPQALQAFKEINLNATEMVTLLGGHSVGVAHCSFFRDRLSNDSKMDPALAAQLKRTCVAGSDPTTFLDQGTPFRVDNQFYNQIALRRGILNIDHELASDPSTAGIVSRFRFNSDDFLRSFGDVMIKLGSTKVLVGNTGEIRQNCRAFNKKQDLTQNNQRSEQKPNNQGNEQRPNNQGNEQKQNKQGNVQKPNNQGNEQRPNSEGNDQNTNNEGRKPMWPFRLF